MGLLGKLLSPEERKLETWKLCDGSQAEMKGILHTLTDEQQRAISPRQMIALKWELVDWKEDTGMYVLYVSPFCH